MSAQPVEPIEDQGPAQTILLHVWFDGEPLEVAAIAAPSPDRVGTSHSVDEPKPSNRCCIQRVSESVDVKGPRGWECRLIDPDSFCAVTPQSCSVDPWTVVVSNPRREIGEVAGEQT